MNRELTDVQAGFKKAEDVTKQHQQQRNQRSNCQHLLGHRKSKRVPEKIYFCLIDYAKAFDCVDHNELWEIL